MNNITNTGKSNDHPIVEECEARIENAWWAHLNYRWAIGDAINEMQKRPEIGKLESYRRAASIMGKSVRWAAEMSRVADAFPPEQRGEKPWYEYRKELINSEANGDA